MEFFSLRNLLNTEKQHEKHYVIIRLVTVFEQFCRQIISEQIKNKKFKKLPNEITLKSQSLDNLKILSKELIISSSYSFQSVNSISNLKDYDIQIVDDDLLADMDKLFTSRHDVVHTVMPTKYNINNGYDITEKLILDILEKSVLGCQSFYAFKGNYLSNTNSKMALECYDEAIALNPNYVEAWVGKGIVLFYTDKFKEALNLFENSLTLKPNYVDAWLWKIYTLCKLGKFDEALESANKAIALDPNYGEAWVGKGIVLYYMDKFKEALEIFEKSITLIPDNVGPWLWEIDVLRKLGKFDEALEGANKAITLKPDSAEAWNHKGMILSNLQKFEESLKCFEKAITLKPTYVEAIQGRNTALSNLGKRDSM
ncbi:MAG: tetratricopeptide repeat protein [Candidatus Nitrosoabyssus spongiisocia]|nr:MAG: tetratricopeptide repeat protein [Nitrosopumilaceae archaeon AB1(1)]